jgi:hypothetical protein
MLLVLKTNNRGSKNQYHYYLKLILLLFNTIIQLLKLVLLLFNTYKTGRKHQ